MNLNAKIAYLAFCSNVIIALDASHYLYNKYN